MKRDLSAEDLAERWTLAPDERLLVFARASASGLGFAALLKFFQAEGRFPWHPQEVPPAAIEYLARQTGLDAAEWWRYDWKGRTIKYHRAEIRTLLGFREASLADSDSLLLWLHEHCLANERNPERVKAMALARLRELHLEPPTTDRVDRLVRSAIASYEENLCATVLPQLSPETRAGLMVLLKPIPRPTEESQADSEEEKFDPAPLHELRREPGKASLQTVEEELAKLERVRNLKLPSALFAGIPAKLLQSYRQRVAVEELFELRRHPDPLRFTLLAAYCHLRSEELTDTLLELLLEMVHRISSRAAKRVDEELRRDVHHVPGKNQLLFRIALAALEQPEGTIRAVVFTVVSERILRNLVTESQSVGPAYRDHLQQVMRNAYRSHYRRMLTCLLETLDFRSSNDRHRPVMEALALIRKHVDSRLSAYPSDEIVPLDEIVPETWRDIVIEHAEDGAIRINRVAYEICVLEALRDRLRIKEVWVQGAQHYRDPNQDLPADFANKRDDYYAALRIPQDGKVFLAQVRQELEEELRIFNEDLPNNKAVKLLDRKSGWISLSPMARLAEPQNLRHLKAEMLSRWANTSLLDVFKEADFRIQFTDVFRSATAFASIDRRILQTRLLLTLYGLGTNTGLKRVSNGHRTQSTRICFMSGAGTSRKSNFGKRSVRWSMPSLKCAIPGSGVTARRPVPRTPSSSARGTRI